MDLGFVPRNARFAVLESSCEFQNGKRTFCQPKVKVLCVVQTRTGWAQSEKEIINSKPRRNIGQECITGRSLSGKDFVKTIYTGAYTSGAMSRKGKQLSVWL